MDNPFLSCLTYGFLSPYQVSSNFFEISALQMGSEDIFTLPRRDSDLVSTSTGSGSAFLKEGQGPVEMLEFALKNRDGITSWAILGNI